MVSYRAINWVLQRVTGALLVILLAMHFWVEHFMADVRHGELSFQLIQSRIANPWMQAVDISFLFVALYHGLNGLRNIILDFSIVTPAMARVCTVIIILGGILWAYWGVTAFVGNPEITKGLVSAATGVH
jgi:succinate dehydrogenase / fumarate reductase membrane anchor subunit